jgi:hypothetical protein
MRQKVVKLIKHFLGFFKTFDLCKVCSMLALMLEPPFQIFMGCENAIHLAIEYDET